MDLFERIREFNVQEEVSEAVYQRGVDYHRQRLVRLLSASESQISLSVMGSEPYKVDFFLERNRFSYDCDCPAYTNWGTCKHIVASDLFVKHSNPSLFVPQNDDVNFDIDSILENGRAVFPNGSGYEGEEPTGGWLLLVSLRSYSWSEFYEPVYMALDLSRAPQRLSKGKTGSLPGRIFDFLSEAENQPRILKGLNQSFDPAECANASWPLIKSIQKATAKGERKGFLAARDMESLANFGIPLFIGSDENPIEQPLYWDQDDHEIDLVIEKADGGVQFTPKLGDQLLCQGDGWGTGKRFDPGRHWVLMRDRILRCHRHLSVEQVAVLDELARVHYQPQEEIGFFDIYFEGLLPHINLKGNGLNEVDVEPTLPTLQFSVLEDVDEDSGDVRLLLRAGFRYDEFAIDWSDRLQFHFWRMSDYDPATTVELLRIQRNIPAETDFLREFDHKKYGLTPDRDLGAGFFKLRRGTSPADFLLHMMPSLAVGGYDLLGEQSLQFMRVNRHEPELAIDVVSYTDWFDLKPLIQFGDVPVALDQIKLAIKRKETLVVLEDGAMGEIPERWLEKLRPMFGLGERIDEESFRFSDQQVLLIDQLLQEADVASPDQHFSERLADLQNFEGIADMDVSWAFTGQLRPYQQAGYNWLHFLRDYGYCGILADDMGLGKTVQVLAFLQSCRDLEDDQKPADLVIMPRSLLFNWQREAERFTPNLRTMLYYGHNKQKRLAAEFEEVDLIFTTYGTVLNDIENLQEYDFNTIVLDESQSVKNPAAKTSRAVRLLNGRHRLAMTGTPIENTTLELWSQFAYLMPGYLGNQTYFRENFRNPIEKKKNEEVAKTLHNIIRPFVMRRTKEQVALDLPPRTEEVIYLEMEPNQRRLYNKVRDQYRAELLGLIDAGQLEQSRLVLLTGLLRLRQICLHPNLVQAEFKGDAAKFLYLQNMLEELEANHHKALIFSQFTGALDLIEGGLNDVGFPSLRIDGSTRDRQKMVDRFQESDEIPFFLLSLKAAGVGLNLTAADYVILMDPWWNPAVERQAIDRAYRIGQTKPVFVYRLIMKDSVEEKVRIMQAEKQDLADRLIQTEESFAKKLSAADIRSLFS